MRRDRRHDGGLLRRTGRALRRALGRMAWSDFRRWALLVAGGSEGQVARPMAQVAHVYRAAMVIATTVASFPPLLRRRGPGGTPTGDPLGDGPAWELINAPYPGMTWTDLAEEIAGHLVTSGAAFVLDADLLDDPLGRLERLGPPRRLVAVGQSQMKPRYREGSDELAYWEFWPRRGSGRVPVAEEWAWYVRLFNPDDDYLGLSPIEAATLGIRQDYRAAVFNTAALENGGQPGGLYVFAEDPGEERRREFRRMIEEHHGGPERANRPGILWGAVDYKQTAFSMVDLALIESRKLSREEIFEAMGVPPVLGCVFDAAHYNIADAAQEIFLENTIKPLVAKIVALFNGLILPRVQPGVMLELDIESHPIAQKAERAKYQSLGVLLASGVPYNEAVRALRLPFGDQPWGDTSLLSATYTTATDVLAGYGGPAEELPPSEEREEPEARRPPTRPAPLSRAELLALGEGAAAAQRRDQRMIAAAIPRIRARFRAHFVRQEREIVRRLRRELKPSAGAAQRAELNEAEAERIARRVMLDLAGEQARLRRMVTGYFPDTTRRALAAELGRLGVPEAQIDGLVEKLLKGRWFQRVLRRKANRIVGIERVTRRRVQATLIQGLRAGETVSELAARVHRALGGNRARALTIARTEAGQAVSTGQFMAARAAGATGKGWLTGANPRATHLQAGRRYAPRGGAIPMEAYFAVGADRLLYPRDPNGSPGEIINCNCTLVSVRLKKERTAA